MNEVLLLIEGFVRPTQADKQLAGEIVRTGIRERTARGVDVGGAPFAPYNETRPYFYNVSAAGGKIRGGRFGEPVRRFTIKAERAAVTRLIRKLRAGALAEGTPLLKTSVPASQTGRTIRFKSYGAFKRAFGRANVDLMGVRSPHMLDALQVHVVADGVKISIDDSRAKTIASGHTTEHRPKGMPLRRFFGIAEEDKRKVLATLADRIRERIRSRQT